MNWQTLSCHNLAITTVNGDGSIFPHNPNVKNVFDYKGKTKFCLAKEGSAPDFDFQYNEFGDNIEQMSQYSNIVFVNGEMDPWLPGCVQK